MLKFFAHCWLILSLLVAPVQFAAADMTVLDHGEMKCESMTMQGQHEMPTNSMDHGMTQGSCECSEQCKISCASAHISLGISSSIMPLAEVTSTHTLSVLTTSIHGINRLTELRPPKV